MAQCQLQEAGVFKTLWSVSAEGYIVRNQDDDHRHLHVRKKAHFHMSKEIAPETVKTRHPKARL